MADADELKGYRPSSPPRIEGSEANYLQQELSKLRTTVESIVSVIRKLEARLVAGGH